MMGRPERLAGVRLGELERTLLMNAPRQGLVAGLLIDAPEGTRSAQQGYLRAAKKLENLGLIRRERIRQASRAFDPRREAPLYFRGRLWTRGDPSRRHLVWRVAIWATPFGEGIRRVYARELKTRRSIRWTHKKVTLAQKFEMATYRNPEDHNEAVANLEGMLLDEREGPSERISEVHPDAVTKPGDYERWLASVRLARRQHPHAGGARLWNEAVEKFESEAETGDLAAEAGLAGPPPSDRPPLRFNRTELGVVIPTDPKLLAELRQKMSAAAGADEPRMMHQPKSQ